MTLADFSQQASSPISQDWRSSLAGSHGQETKSQSDGGAVHVASRCSGDNAPGTLYSLSGVMEAQKVHTLQDGEFESPESDFKITRDANGRDIKVGDRVMFNRKGLNGYGEMGTVTRIERDCPWDKAVGANVPFGPETNYVLWVRWDCHGYENGECIDINEGSRDWVFSDRQTLLPAEVPA